MEKVRINLFCTIICFVLCLLVSSSCKKKEEEVLFPRNEDGYLKGGALINGELYYTAGMNIVENKKIPKPFDEKRNISWIWNKGTIEIERTNQLEIYLPQRVIGYQWEIENRAGMKIEETTYILTPKNITDIENIEDAEMLANRSWVVQKYLIKLEDDVTEVVFRREKNEASIDLVEYQLTIALKEENQFSFPRDGVNCPDNHCIKIDDVIYEMPNIKLATAHGSQIKGSMTIEREKSYDIYLAMGSVHWIWDISIQDGMTVEESWMNLYQESDLDLIGSSWEIQKFHIELDENVTEIKFKWYAFPLEKGKEFDNINETYLLTIKIK